METNREARTFPSGIRIFREGDLGDCAYIIKRGRVRICADRGGREVVLAEICAGDVFGEVALIDAGPRSAHAIALEDTEVLEIRRSSLSRTLDEADPLVPLMLQVLADRFREAQGRVGVAEGEPPPSTPSSTALEELRRSAFERIWQEEALRQALKAEEFELHYQPIVSLVTGVIAGFEALIRWRSPQLGLLSPDQFIPLAEGTGLIVEIGDWVLREAIGTHAGFVEQYSQAFPHEPLPYMSVNLSPAQLRSPAGFRLITEALSSGTIDPALVRLELTETLLVSDPESAKTLLEEIKALGVSLAMDDFGIGYSSLSYLCQFPFDTLKIDRSFVHDMMRREDSLRIVRSIVAMAHELELSVVAEGIEQEEQSTLLCEFGCEYGQGYLFAKPGPREETEDLLRSKASW